MIDFKVYHQNDIFFGLNFFKVIIIYNNADNYSHDFSNIKKAA